MSKFSDSLIQVLSGGIPSLVDGGTGADTGAATTQVSPQRVEEIAPTGTIVDREPFNLATVGTSKNILLVTAGILAFLGVILIARR